MLMWCLVVRPAALVNRLAGTTRLLRLVVIVELPWQIADREKHNDNSGDQPECPTAEETGLSRNVLNHERRSGQVLQKITKVAKIFNNLRKKQPLLTLFPFVQNTFSRARVLLASVRHRRRRFSKATPRNYKRPQRHRSDRAIQEWRCRLAQARDDSAATSNRSHPLKAGPIPEA